MLSVEGKSHVAIGGAFGISIGALIHAPVADQVVMLAIGAFGGLTPDLDMPGSLLGRLLPRWWHRLTPGHRGVTHSIYFCVLTFGLAWLAQYFGHKLFNFWGLPATPYVPIALAIGAFSHVFADGLTTRGVPFFYPMKRRFKLLGPLNFATGTRPEHAVVAVTLALSSAIVAYPSASPMASGLVFSPTVMGISARPAVIFATLVLVSGLILTIRSLLRPPPRKRQPHRCPH